MWFWLLLSTAATVAVAKVYLKLTTGINKCSKHLLGKVVIVTGGNAGIGYETAKDLADRGARVIIGCRNERRGTTARDKIIAATGNQDVHYKNIDFACLSTVRKFADEIIASEKRIDILVNNAGVIEGELEKTEDGLIVAMQINHFGPFLLTNLLLPLLMSSAPSRIVNVASIAYIGGKIDFDNLNYEKETKESFNFINLYNTSKLANVLTTVHLKTILEGSGVTVNVLNPGMVSTSITNGVEKWWFKYLYAPVFHFMAKNAWEGAQTSIYLAVSPDVKDVSGRYFSDCKEVKLREHGRDAAVAKKLWEASERLVKLK